MKCTATATLQLLFFLTSSGSWNTQKAISSLEPSGDVDTVTAMGKSETSVGRGSSDEDDDDDDASCEWFSGFSVGERDRRSTFADRSRRSCIHLYVLVLWRIGPRICAHSVRTTCADLRRYYARSAIPRQNIPRTRAPIHRTDKIMSYDRLLSVSEYSILASKVSYRTGGRGPKRAPNLRSAEGLCQTQKLFADSVPPSPGRC